MTGRHKQLGLNQRPLYKYENLQNAFDNLHKMDVNSQKAYDNISPNIIPMEFVAISELTVVHCSIANDTQLEAKANSAIMTVAF